MPVLLLIHARPQQTQVVLEAIKDWDISHLYIAADGPRADRPGEIELCQSTRDIALGLAGDRPCTTLFRDENLGLASAVSSAIDWFFEHEDEGIILEDDCVPQQTFLPFCSELLARYRDTPHVMMISGNNFLDPSMTTANSYRFTRHAQIWGWATWRRAWQLHDPDIKQWSGLRSSSWLVDVCQGDRHAARYWRWIFDRVLRARHRSWDYPWTFSMWLNGGVAIMPGRNLVTNIGFGDHATNTQSLPLWYAGVTSGPLQFPLDHPAATSPDPLIDHWIDQNVLRTHSRWYRSMRLIARVAGPLGWEGRLRRIYKKLQLRVISHG